MSWGRGIHGVLSSIIGYTHEVKEAKGQGQLVGKAHSGDNFINRVNRNYDDFTKNHCHFEVSKTVSLKSSLKCLQYLQKCHCYLNDNVFLTTNFKYAS